MNISESKCFEFQSIDLKIKKRTKSKAMNKTSKNQSLKKKPSHLKKYWLMKSDEDSYSISDFKKDKKTLWDGVRNYQARNFMINDMNIGDEVLFYHSNSKEPGVVGFAKISSKAQPDPTALDPKSKYYDQKASKERPIWECVEVQYIKKLKNKITISQMRKDKALKKMLLLKKGQRLSIQPLDIKEFQHILKLSETSLKKVKAKK